MCLKMTLQYLIYTSRLYERKVSNGSYITPRDGKIYKMVQSGKKPSRYVGRTSHDLIPSVGYLLTVASSDQIIVAVSPPVSPSLTCYPAGGCGARALSSVPTVPTVRQHKYFSAQTEQWEERESPQSGETLSYQRTLHLTPHTSHLTLNQFD